MAIDRTVKTSTVETVSGERHGVAFRIGVVGHLSPSETGQIAGPPHGPPGDRPGGGAEWACPFCPQQVVFWSIYHKVMVKGWAEVLHVRAIREVPVHLDDVILELTEADENWLTLNAIAWSGVAAQ